MYCVTRQWPLPREQCEVIDAFFAEKVKSGMVRESKSPHSAPTFYVRKPNEEWLHVYNKLNNATVRAQTLIPRKDVLLNNMSGCTLHSALDLVDGYYQILMRESDTPLTAVSTPSVMLREWLTYFDDIFVHSRAEGGQTAMERVFAADEIKVIDFDCFVSRVDVRADPGKVKTIAAWPTPRSQKDLRKWLGLANYLHKYSAGYAELARPLSDLLKKDADWVWEQQHQNAFDSIKASLQQAPVLALPDENKSFSVVCDASDYVIGCALLQKDDEGRERVISVQSRQLKASERNYPVHDKELLAMKVKPSGHISAPLQSLPVPADCWKSMSLDFVFGLPADDKGNTGILAFVCRLSKMVHLAPVRDKVTGKQAAQLFLDSVFHYHCLPETIVSDRDLRFTGAFWDTLFQLLGTKLTMPTADHPQTDGQKERAKRVLEDTLCGICAEAPRSWSDQLPMDEFALNNTVHASTGFIPFYLNGLRYPRVPLTLQRGPDVFIVSGGEARKAFSSLVSDIEPESLKRQLPSSIEDRLTLISRVRDAMASAQDKQKEDSDKHETGNLNVC
ncbi:Reverse transcriptase [Phytophthora palmivora]|uniref:Reverse transcriptase n=1 Tax=Phytophthora palmivora TaxID=4796 RepID=A0A2P4XV93_9STRA|nr:Reverse transcriptase [Phytophthora palmivora]